MMTPPHRPDRPVKPPRHDETTHRQAAPSEQQPFVVRYRWWLIFAALAVLGLGTIVYAWVLAV